MSVRKNPKISALVVNAIRRLQDVQGSTSKEISNYIAQEYDIPGTDIRRQVQLALRRGLSYGILQRTKGGYYVCNTVSTKVSNGLQDEGFCDKLLGKKMKRKTKRNKCKSKSHRSRSKKRKCSCKGGKKRGGRSRGRKSRRHGRRKSGKRKSKSRRRLKRSRRGGKMCKRSGGKRRKSRSKSRSRSRSKSKRRCAKPKKPRRCNEGDVEVATNNNVTARSISLNRSENNSSSGSIISESSDERQPEPTREDSPTRRSPEVGTD